jgi:ATP adenylyltransferase
MKRIWAPWRMKYILSEEEKGCFLCRAWESPESAAHHVLKKGEEAFVIMNAYPYNNGHLMVACAAHAGELNDVTATARAEVMELVNYSVERLRKAFSPHGFNVGINLGTTAGAGLTDHLHVHIVPRWEGDTNYMPLLGEVKVISEHLDETYRKLSEYFK